MRPDLQTVPKGAFVPTAHTRLIWWLIAVMASSTIASFLLAGLTVDLTSNPPAVAAIGALLATGWFYRTARPNAHLEAIITSAVQILLILLFGILLTYAAMAANFPYRDAELHLIDQALGLDRRAYLAFFDSRPWLSSAVGLAYLTLLPQFALVPLVLFFNDQLPRLQIMIFAIGIALILTSAISVVTPAVDAFVYVDITPPVFAKIADQLHTQVPTLEALRSGALRTIRLDNLEGLITFPSFHTAGGILFAWTLWHAGIFRWPGFALNAALISATPVVGAHYFIDLAGGAAVAIISVLFSNWLCRPIAAADLPHANPASTLTAS